MKKKVYKVVHLENDKRVSAWCTGKKTCVTYPIGEEFKPDIGKFFAFTNLGAAIDFARHIAHQPSEIWEATGTGVKKPDSPFITTNPKSLEREDFLESFWSGNIKEALRVLGWSDTKEEDLVGSVILPKDTVLCSAIKLRKLLEEAY